MKPRPKSKTPVKHFDDQIEVNNDVMKLRSIIDTHLRYIYLLNQPSNVRTRQKIQFEVGNATIDSSEAIIKKAKMKLLLLGISYDG